MVADALAPGEKLLYKQAQHPSKRKRTREQCKVYSARSLYLITLFSVAFIALVRYSFGARQQETKACDMSYMFPSYRYLHGFDHEHTRFASKYSLYLYRELTIDTNEDPQGVPVLFVPGNAGSYKQIRPLAAEAAAQFQLSSKEDPSALLSGKRSLDFFTVDFNEDFSAFHGQTMLDQAEYLNSAITYILSLYTDARKSPSFRSLPDPTSVIVIGHSMGGIVARLTQLMPNYLPKSINTIITMSTPHATPPAPFDPLIQRIYEDINTFWHRSFSMAAEENPLQDVSLISIAGGGLDTIVSSDYTSAQMIVPASNGFTVFTSTIPYVWISADHQAILWCDQFRKVVARALLECVDARRGTQTSTVSQRMDIFSRHLLSRLDKERNIPTLANQQRSTLPLEGHALPIEYHTYTSDSLRRRSFVPDVETVDVLQITDPSDKMLQFLTNIPPERSDSEAAIAISLCRKEGANSIQTEMSDEFPSLSCVEVTQDLTVLPSQYDLTRSGNDQRLYYLQYNTSSLSGHDILVVRSKGVPDNGFLAAEVLPQKMLTDLKIVTNIFSLSFSGIRVILGPSRNLRSTLRINGIISSLISYKLQITSKSCTEPLMDSVTRQHMAAPFESKYFRGTQDMDISVHGQAPFFPPVFSADRRLVIDHFPDPACAETLDITLFVDYVGSLGKLVMRFRVVMIVYPFVIALLVFLNQNQRYDRTGSLVSYQQALRSLTQKGLVWLLVALSVASFLFAYVQNVSVMSLEDYFSIETSSQLQRDYIMLINNKLLGLQDPILWWLAPLFMLVSIGVLNIATLLLDTVIRFSARVLDMTKGISKIATYQAERSPKRRILTTTILLAFVSFLVPYQFAYIVACIVQLATCVRLLRSNDVSFATDSYNLNFGILVLMICVLPINIPILVVWVRNISVQWFTPFSSHHNVLSVAPTMLLVESLSNGWLSLPVTSHLSKLPSLVILIMTVVVLLYGVMYTYLLHHIFNVLAGCIVLYKHLASHAVPYQAQTETQ